jgi:hypothetical protein
LVQRRLYLLSLVEKPLTGRRAVLETEATSKEGHMRIIRNAIIGLGILTLAAVYPPHLTAQSVQEIQSIAEAAPDSIVAVTAGAYGLTQMAPEDLPPCGTFWEVMPYGLMAPLPCPPFDLTLPIYAIAENTFLVDATGGAVSAMPGEQAMTRQSVTAAVEAQGNAIADLIEMVQEVQLERDFAEFMGVELMSLESEGASSSALLYDPAGLWLEITNVASDTVFANLHNGTNQVYAVWGTTNLQTDWQVETELWPQGINSLPFTLPTLNRDNLFLRAEDWTGKDSNGDGVPDWWAWKYFGTTDINGAGRDFANTNWTFGYESSNNITPTVFRFDALAVTNIYVNTSQPTVQAVVTGWPYYAATQMDSTDFSNVVWNTYTSSNIAVNLGLTEGWHDVWVGLRGHAETNGGVWQSTRLKLDFTPPQLLITNLPSLTVSVPMIQIQGLVNEQLSKLTYDVSNAVSAISNQTGYTSDLFYDTNELAFTTNTFQCYDVALAEGQNFITIRATDLAGNITATNFTVTVDYSGDSTAPVVNVVWPQAGMRVSGEAFTLRAAMDDATATVRAYISDASGTNTMAGRVMRDGAVWVDGLPLGAGTNQVILIAEDAAGNRSTNNLNVIKSAVTVTVNALESGQLSQRFVTASGTVSDTNHPVTVNGVTATVYADGIWTANNVPVADTGMATITVNAGENGADTVGSNIRQTAKVALGSAEFKSELLDRDIYSGEYYQDYLYEGNWVKGKGGFQHMMNWRYSWGSYYLEDDFTLPFGPDETPSDFIVPEFWDWSSGDDSWLNYYPGSRSEDNYYWHKRAKVVLDSGKTALPGIQRIYLVRARAMQYAALSSEQPLAPQQMKIQGQVLENTGEISTNAGWENCVWGQTIVQGTEGVDLDVTPIATLSPGCKDYDFDVTAQPIGLTTLETHDRYVHGVIESAGSEVVDVTIQSESSNLEGIPQVQALGAYHDVFGNDPQGTTPQGTVRPQVYASEADILSDAEVDAMDNGTYNFGSQQVIFVRDPANPNRLHFYTVADNYGKVIVMVDALNSPLHYLTQSDHPLQPESFGNTINYLDQRIDSPELVEVLPMPITGGTPTPIKQRNLLTKTLIQMFKGGISPQISLVHGTVDGFMGGAHSDYEGLVGIKNLITSSAQRAAAFKALTTWSTYTQIPTAIANGLTKFMSDAEKSALALQPLQFDQQDFATDLTVRSYVGGYAAGFTTEQICVAAVGAGVVAKGSKIAEMVSKVTLGEHITTVAVDAVKTAQAFKTKTVDFAINAAAKTARTTGLPKAASTMADAVSKLAFGNGQTVGDIITTFVERLDAIHAEIAGIPKPLGTFGVKAHEQVAKLLSRDLGYYPGEKATRACVMLCNKLEDGVRYENFIKGFTKADGTVAKDQLKNSLDAYYDVTRNLADGECPALPVKGIDQIHPTLYHYADRETLINFADDTDGWVLNAMPSGKSRYITPENVLGDASHSGQSIAKDKLQLPYRESAPGVEDATTGRFKCIIDSSEIADDCSVPRGYDHSTPGLTDTQRNLDHIEPVVTDNPSRGGGGSIQFTQQKSVRVRVFDTKTFPPVEVFNKAELESRISQFP